MPSGAEMFNIIQNFTVAYRAERAMSTFITMLLWTSITELLLFGGTFISFCAAPMRLAIVFLQILHIPRGIFGIILAVKLPRSHDVIDRMELTQHDC